MSWFDRDDKRRNSFSRPRNESFSVSEPNAVYPKVIFKRPAFLKMKALITECDIEVSWMGSCEHTSQGDYEIQDVYVPNQRCSSVTTDMTEDGVALLMEELIETGKFKDIAKLKCWGHSHVNMGVFASGTDEQQTTDFTDRQDEFFIRLIGNKKGDMSCHVYIMKSEGVVERILHHPEIVIEEASHVSETVYGPIQEEDMSEWAKSEIEAKVQRPFFRKPKKKPEDIKEEDEPIAMNIAGSTVKFITDLGEEVDGALTELLKNSLTSSEQSPKEEAQEQSQEDEDAKTGT